MRIDKMSRETSVKLGDLAESSMLVSGDRTHTQVNDAAVELLGDDWQARAEALVAQIDSPETCDQWHHRVLSSPSGGRPLQFAIHATRCHDGCQLILLNLATASDLAPPTLLEDVLESMNDSFFALDGAGVFVYANSNAAAFFGSSREELVGQTPLSIRPFDARFSEAYNKAMHEGVSVTYDARSPGQDLWLEIRGYPVGKGMACYFTDITERVVSQERIAFMAVHDTLTGLPNRQFLQEQLAYAVARGKRGRMSALLFLDMDRFKLVNDTVGHAAGDGVLVEFAAVIEQVIRDEDVLARFGGDEFAMLVEAAGADEGFVVCDRIQEAVRTHDFCYENHSFSLGVSIGMTLIDGSLDEGHAMALADDAMYEAKKRGGGQMCYRSPASPSDAPQCE